LDDVKPRPGRQTDILETFTEMVAERGYDLTSVADIAADLGLSKGTIMYHFRSKDRLLQQMSLEYMQRRSGELEAITEGESKSTARLAAVITGLMVAFRDDRAATIAFSREFMRFANEPVMAEVREMRRRYLDRLRCIIQSGIDGGEIVPVDPQIVALEIIGMCSWCWTWFDPGGRLSAEEIGAMFSASLLDGLVESS
jgi:AcrR family transcriptional regulator